MPHQRPPLFKTEALPSHAPVLNLKAVIVHDDLELARKAWTKLMMLEDHVDGVSIGHVKRVYLHAIHHDGDAEQAARLASQADLIFVALKADTMSSPWKQWFQRWANRRAPQSNAMGALVCLLQNAPQEKDAPSAAAFLKTLADSTGMHFIQHEGSASAAN